VEVDVLATQKKTKEETAGGGSSTGTATAQKPKKADDKVGTLTAAIEKLSVMELSELVKALEDKFGVSAAAVTAVAAAPAAGAAAPEAPAEEQTEFTVVLTSFGDKKIQVIKEVRAITGLGLKEAKDLVDGVPKPVKEGVSKEQVDEIKTKIEAAGGVVEVK
jgi:large subunit ribosomal protein L7/L12